MAFSSATLILDEQNTRARHDRIHRKWFKMHQYYIKPICIFLIGIFLLPCMSFSETLFSDQNGYHVFESDNGYGLMQTNGNVVIPPQYDGILPIMSDLVIVQLDEFVGLWNTEGEKLLDPSYVEIIVTDSRCIIRTDDNTCLLYDPVLRDFCGDAHYSIWDGGDGSHFGFCDYCEDSSSWNNGLMDSNGHVCVPCDYCSILGSKDGIFLLVDRMGKCFYYDSGRIVSKLDSMSFDYATRFYDGCAVVRSDQGMQIIDSTGELVSEAFEYIEYDETCSVFLARRQGLWYILTIDGENARSVREQSSPIPDQKPDMMSPYLCAFYSEGNACVIDLRSLEEHVIHGVVGIGKMMNGVSIIRDQDGLAGYLFDDYRIVPPQYTDVTFFVLDRAFVQISGVYYPIDRNGEPDMQKPYQNISNSDDTKFFIVDNGYNYFILDGLLNVVTVMSFVYEG